MYWSDHDVENTLTDFFNENLLLTSEFILSTDNCNLFVWVFFCLTKVRFKSDTKTEMKLSD